MGARKGCEARQEQDEMVCNSCGFRWDVKDPDPPECDGKTHTRRVRVPGKLQQITVAGNLEDGLKQVAKDPAEQKLGRKPPKVFTDMRDKILTQNAEHAGEGHKMVLYCPECNGQHIDKGEYRTKLHKTHLCEYCGAEWRPFNYPTRGALNV